jgi:hypothetical protein
MQNILTAGCIFCVCVCRSKKTRTQSSFGNLLCDLLFLTFCFAYPARADVPQLLAVCVSIRVSLAHRVRIKKGKSQRPQKQLSLTKAGHVTSARDNFLRSFWNRRALSIDARDLNSSILRDECVALTGRRI